MNWLHRMRLVGFALIAMGLVVAGMGFFYGMPQANDGLDSAQAMYEDQGISLTYNEAGQLTDRGSPEQAQEILALLEDTWRFPVDRGNLDPSDPLVNTRDELMYEYAVIVFHVKHGTVDVVLSQEQIDAAGGAIEYRGVTYDAPGTYAIAVEKDYGELDRTHPIEGQLRAAWSPLALSLLAFLTSGHANQGVGELAWFTSLGMGGIGLLFAVAGAGMAWIGFAPSRLDA